VEIPKSDYTILDLTPRRREVPWISSISLLTKINLLGIIAFFVKQKRCDRITYSTEVPLYGIIMQHEKRLTEEE